MELFTRFQARLFLLDSLHLIPCLLFPNIRHPFLISLAASENLFFSENRNMQIYNYRNVHRDNSTVREFEPVKSREITLDIKISKIVNILLFLCTYYTLAFFIVHAPFSFSVSHFSKIFPNFLSFALSAGDRERGG